MRLSRPGSLTLLMVAGLLLSGCSEKAPDKNDGASTRIETGALERLVIRGGDFENFEPGAPLTQEADTRDRQLTASINECAGIDSPQVAGSEVVRGAQISAYQGSVNLNSSAYAIPTELARKQQVAFQDPDYVECARTNLARYIGRGLSPDQIVVEVANTGEPNLVGVRIQIVLRPEEEPDASAAPSSAATPAPAASAGSEATPVVIDVLHQFWRFRDVPEGTVVVFFSAEVLTTVTGDLPAARALAGRGSLSLMALVEDQLAAVFGPDPDPIELPEPDPSATPSTSATPTAP